MISPIKSPSHTCKHVLPVYGCVDITYIPMQRVFLYLVAIMDWYSRKVLSWRLSNSMEADFCVEALKEAIEKYLWTEKVAGLIIERLWRSVKYECIYLSAFETGSKASEGIGKWFAYYNLERPHSTMEY